MGDGTFADDRLTVADLKVFVSMRQLKSGILDHIPADLPDRVAPKLVEQSNRRNAADFSARSNTCFGPAFRSSIANLTFA